MSRSFFTESASDNRDSNNVILSILAILALIVFLILAIKNNFWKSDENKDHKYTLYTIKYDLNGGNGTIEDSIVSENSMLIRPLDPTRDNYNFVGWYKDNQLYNFDAPVTESFKLTAHWTYKEDVYYLVSFLTNGGEGYYEDIAVKSGDIVVKPEDPIRSGYTFMGWYSNDVRYNFSKPVTSNIILNAHWKAESNTRVVTFNINGGRATSIIESQRILIGDKVTKPTQTIIRPGYNFVGWFKDGVLYDFSTPVTDSFTLTAMWSKNDKNTYYSVSFSLNGGVGTASAQQVLAGSYAKRPEDPVRNGYTFKGWFEGAVAYDFNSPVYNNVSLKAYWVKNDVDVVIHTVSFNLNGGTGYIPPQQVKSGTKAQRPSDPVREGYYFFGWYYDNKLFNFYKTNVVFDMELEARWGKIN